MLALLLFWQMGTIFQLFEFKQQKGTEENV